MNSVYQLDITLEEPAILTDGSSESSGGHETLALIPGTTVLGAMVATLDIDPERDLPLFHQMFLSDVTCFLNAYPLCEGERTLPRPRTFRQGKFDCQRVIDGIDAGAERRAFGEIQEFFSAATPPDRPKAATAAFVITGSPAVDRSFGSREQVHVAIDRTRRTAEQGMLFTYSALPAGSQFRSFVITSDAAVAARLDEESRTALRLRIGRSRGGGYGTAIAKLARADTAWCEYAKAPIIETAAIVTLLSDYLPLLELPVVNGLTADIIRAGALLETTSIEAIDAAVRTVSGFRGVWGLPRGSRTVLQKGSVFVLRGDFDRDKLREALASGLGGRRNEGYGRIAIDWQLHGSRNAASAVMQRVPKAPRLLKRPQAADPQRLAGIIRAMSDRRHERQRRRFVEVALAHPRTQSVIKALCRVPSAQLGNLRAAMSSGLSAEQIGVWFADIAAKTAGERWKKARVPSLADESYRRNGIGFVWTSLLGGTTKLDGRSDDPHGVAVNFKSAVQKSLASMCNDAFLGEAAIANPDRTLRLFVIGLCGDIVRYRNLAKGERETMP